MWTNIYLSFALVILVGCGSNDRPSSYSITNKEKINAQELRNSMISVEWNVTRFGTDTHAIDNIPLRIKKEQEVSIRTFSYHYGPKEEFILFDPNILYTKMRESEY